MNGQTSHFVAVLDPVRYSQARMRRLLAELGLPATVFERAADLGAALVAGRRFSMLVLSFEGSLIVARAELEHVKAHAGPGTPLMLLMSPLHVELATCVMSSPHADFLLAPFTEDELRERLRVLHLCRIEVFVPPAAADDDMPMDTMPPQLPPNEDSRPLAL